MDGRKVGWMDGPMEAFAIVWGLKVYLATSRFIKSYKICKESFRHFVGK